jgi:glycosyltransferase involved in cell wall biosynthesis
MLARCHPPRLTVAMPVYDAAPFLGAAIESLLRQSYADFELLIIDDGSNDGSGAIADAYAAADRRVRVEHLQHGGLVGARNRCLERANRELIAWADADDWYHPNRLARQVRFLDAHPEVGVCGSWMRTMPYKGVWALPEQWDVLRATLLFSTPLYQPTTMMRRDWLARSGCRYDPAFAHAEDYDFWERTSQLTRFDNIPQALVCYRLHLRQVSAVHRAAQLERSRAIRLRQLVALGLEPTSEEVAVHEDLAADTCGRTREQIEAGGQWLEGLREGNRAAGRYPEPAFTRVLALRWYRNCAEGAVHGAPVVGAFARSPLVRALPDVRWRIARLHALRVLPARLSRRIAGALKRLGP